MERKVTIMDMERMNRLIEAKKYQEKAIKALFPEHMQGHIEVIQKEIRGMVQDGVLQLLQSEAGMELIKTMMNSMGSDTNAETDMKEANKKESKVKKVNIA